MRICFLGMFSILGLLACSVDGDKPPIPEKSNLERGPNVRIPITQVRQTLNLKPAETFQYAFAALQRKNISVSSIDESNGVLETDWIDITDSLCGGHRPQQAPLQCRTRLSFKVEPFEGTASALHIRYKELCSVNEEIPLTCPDSSAERLMLTILNEVKALDRKFE